MKRFLAKSCATFALGSALLAPAVASAADMKFWPGSVCVPINGMHAADLGYGHHGVKNDGTLTRTVVCPIQKDSGYGNQYAGAHRFDIMLRGTRPGADNIVCTLGVAHLHGDLDSVTKNAAGSAVWTMQFGVSEVLNGTYSPEDQIEHIAAICNLPAGATLRYIMTTEFGVTD